MFLGAFLGGRLRFDFVAVCYLGGSMLVGLLLDLKIFSSQVVCSSLRFPAPSVSISYLFFAYKIPRGALGLISLALVYD